MRSLHKITPIFLVFAFAVWVPSASFAELAKWDQERVAALGEELAKACSELYDTFLKEPQSTIGSGQESSYYRLRQLIRRVRTEARHLSSSLAKGEGYEETLPIYENLSIIVRDAAENSRRIFSSGFVLEKATAAGDALRRIAPYYDPEVLEGG
jgi:hypothetical protein